MASSSNGSIAPPFTSADSPSALSAQEALARLRSAQEAAAEALDAHDADAQLASLHEASDQLADDQEASAHEAESQEVLAQEASLFAFVAQLAESKTGAPVTGSLAMKVLRARFGFGGLTYSIEREALTSPTPSDMLVALGSGFAPSISAPLTWSGVKSGCLPRISAAMPLTMGAANEVPESSM